MNATHPVRRTALASRMAIAMLTDSNTRATHSTPIAHENDAIS
jgi:hypothetical protein